MITLDFPHRLIFLRHGETDWNVEGRLQGQRDIPLNAKGVDQAQSAGRAARKLIAPKTPFVASPLTRTRRTMELARSAMGLPPFDYQTDDRLKEISFGAWEGLTWREVKARDPGPAQARARDKWGHPPPGGESYAMLADRLAPWLSGLTGDTLVVSHGGVARAIMALIGGLDPAEAPTTEIAQGRVLLFEGGGYRWV